MFQLRKRTHRLHTYQSRPVLLSSVLVLMLFLASCGPGSSDAVVPTRAPAPTFTPTQQGDAPAPQPAPANTEPPPVDNAGTDDAVIDIPAEQTNSEDAAQSATEPEDAASEDPASEPAPTEPQAATAIVAIPLLNVRGGPGLTYNILGGINQGERYVITGRNEAGDWWQIDYNGQAGWVFNELVTTENAESVALATNIPTPPPPTPTTAAPPTPVPTNTPVPAPVAEAPAPAPAPAESNLPFQLLDTAKCEPNAGSTYFSGFVRYNDNSPRNAVCVHLHFYEPRTTKCSGCDGVGDGVWGFSPFGGPAPPGTPIEIWVVECPDSLPLGGQSSGFGDLTPLSPKWTHTVNESEQCTGITFVGG